MRQIMWTSTIRLHLDDLSLATGCGHLDRLHTAMMVQHLSKQSVSIAS